MQKKAAVMPDWNRVSHSYWKEEKVVRPPRQPVTRNNLAWGEICVWRLKNVMRNPIQKDPARLTRTVP